MIEVDAEIIRCDLLDEIGKVGKQALIGDVLEIERWQYHCAGAPTIHGMAGEPDRVGQVRQACAGNQLPGIDATIQQALERHDAFFHAERERLARCAEWSEPGAP